MSALVIERSLSEEQLVIACLKLGSGEDRQPGESFIVDELDLQTTSYSQLEGLDADAEEQKQSDEGSRCLETIGILATVSVAELTDRESANATVEQTFCLTVLR